ncbi:Protein kinase [Orpheovirus IHUMI-LCC2]|uniref:Protein kinase n=1 Tax=Orpheovirus IHUMI-LCC2 TaxID=2023057 RepID=A0A2I2L3E9_9VIRU|nr:Protein kinase [Orpheovirus IHUMI-LCC2]SNW61999.1 Protein kinase [Orpheovirus IHUMI-LCC2]
MEVNILLGDKYEYKNLLSNRDEGPIYVYKNIENGEDVVVKTRIKKKECLHREYIIGLKFSSNPRLSRK